MLNDVIQNIENKNLESKEDQFVSINVRPTEKLMSMLEIISVLDKKSPASSLYSNFSEAIFDLLTSSEKMIPVVEAIRDQNIARTGATELLYKREVIRKPVAHWDFGFNRKNKADEKTDDND